MLCLAPCSHHAPAALQGKAAGPVVGQRCSLWLSSKPTARRRCPLPGAVRGSRSACLQVEAAAAREADRVSTAAAARAAAPLSGDRTATFNIAAAETTAAPTPRQSGTLFGAIALITGSTVGAGMLALPAVSAPAGIVPTSLSLVAIWVLLTMDALLIAEVNLAAYNARETASSEGGGSGSSSGIVTLRQMAEFSLGKAGKVITLVYLMLAYSLLTAYTTKAAEVLDYFAGGGLPPLAPSAAFVAAIGGLLYLGGTRAADSLNQGLTSVLLALFAVILTAGASQSSLPSSLLHEGLGGLGAAGDWGALGPAVPIMFLALVYHDLVPVLVSYLGGHRPTIRSAIVLGSLVPLTMFLSWDAVALSLLPHSITDPSAAGAVLEASLKLAPEAGSGAAAAAADAVAAAVPGVASGVASAAAGGGGGAVPVAMVADGPGVIAIDPLEVFVRRSSPLIGSVVEGFSLLAVLTSCIGTTLSLSETLRTEVPPLVREASKKLRRAVGAADVSADLSSCDDELACLVTEDGRVVCGPAAVEERANMAGNEDHHGLALALTLGPPLLLAANNPDSFLGALQIAGGYFMTLLYGVLPPLMAWQLREKTTARRQVSQAARDVVPSEQQKAAGHSLTQASQQHESPNQQQQAASAAAPWWRQHEDMVPGGVPVLAAMFSAAMALELSRLAADAGLAVAGGGDGSGGGAAFLQSLVEAAFLSPATSDVAVGLGSVIQATPL